MFDVTALGEVLVDFTFAGKSGSGMTLFEQNPGGAPANVLTALSRLGKRLPSPARSERICTDFS